MPKSDAPTTAAFELVALIFAGRYDSVPLDESRLSSIIRCMGMPHEISQEMQPNQHVFTAYIIK
jgi:hypothetical protein